MRSSRPWSYFYPEEPALPPRRYNAEHHDDEQDEDLPPVPVPDYTLHFPSKRTYARKISKITLIYIYITILIQIFFLISSIENVKTVQKNNWGY